MTDSSSGAYLSGRTTWEQSLQVGVGEQPLPHQVACLSMDKSALGWPLCLPSLALSPASPTLQLRTKMGVGGLGRGSGGARGSGRQRREAARAPTSLQLAHPLQQRVQGALGLLPVRRGLVVQQGLLVLQLRDLAQQLPLQLPQPPLERLSEVAGQRGARHVPSELVLGGGGGGM